MEIEPGCKTCKDKSNNPGKTKVGVIVFGSYLLFSSVYHSFLDETSPCFFTEKFKIEL